MASFFSEGNIRIRGKRENILRFLQEELTPVYELENDMVEERPIHALTQSNGWIITLRRDPDTSTNIRFKGSDRHWIETDSEAVDVYFSNGRIVNEDHVVCLDRYEGPFCPDYDFWKEKAMKYRVDIRIFSWSNKAWSSIQTWYRNGDIEESSLSYEDFLWNCPFPNFNDCY